MHQNRHKHLLQDRGVTTWIEGDHVDLAHLHLIQSGERKSSHEIAQFRRRVRAYARTRTVVHRERHPVAVRAPLLGSRTTKAGVEDQNVNAGITNPPLNRVGEVPYAGERGEIERQDLDRRRRCSASPTSANDYSRAGLRGDVLKGVYAEAARGPGHEDNTLRFFHS
ncbi:MULTISPECIES: hypothetical protein [unclassified Mesorhizobium]|uniref:hypothetical protein n=1 Tax=Mesorhizobium sp. M4A.F.Ca.ET.020.02.1.1 TaxID=2496652 RepID=UPI00167651AA|nr:MULTISPECIES: hypothetical protein [unclassified Mesorhizobium]